MTGYIIKLTWFFNNVRILTKWIDFYKVIDAEKSIDFDKDNEFTKIMDFDVDVVF